MAEVTETQDDLRRVQYYRIHEGKEVKIAKAVLPFLESLKQC